jgi:hypothetical protein
MTRSRPDILRDTEVTDMINVMEKNKNTIPAMVEDPVRRKYKRILAVTFITTSILYILVELSFQVIYLKGIKLFTLVLLFYRSNLQLPQVSLLLPPTSWTQRRWRSPGMRLTLAPPSTSSCSSSRSSTLLFFSPLSL